MKLDCALRIGHPFFFFFLKGHPLGVPEFLFLIIKSSHTITQDNHFSTICLFICKTQLCAKHRGNRVEGQQGSVRRKEEKGYTKLVVLMLRTNIY